MIYKLLRTDFDWVTDSDGNLTDTYLKELKFSDEDIKNFIEFGYILPATPAKETKKPE